MWSNNNQRENRVKLQEQQQKREEIKSALEIKERYLFKLMIFKVVKILFNFSVFIFYLITLLKV